MDYGYYKGKDSVPVCKGVDDCYEEQKLRLTAEWINDAI